MYDFDSGDLSLDYANTKDWHASQKPVERLKNLNDLIQWGQEAGIITPGTTERLVQEAATDPGKATRDYEQGIQLREAIYRIFSALYAKLALPVDDVTFLNVTVRRANSHLQICRKDADCIWEWSPEVDGIDLILYPVAHAAAELLTSQLAARVRECEDDRGCGYLFIDQTKNHSRRWCSMESCGNRAKAKRHYSRLQAN